MKKLLFVVAMVFSSSFFAGCAVNVDSAEEPLGDPAGEVEEVASAPSAVTSCPSDGQCYTAEWRCDPELGGPYCDLLWKCYQCGWPY